MPDSKDTTTNKGTHRTTTFFGVGLILLGLILNKSLLGLMAGEFVKQIIQLPLFSAIIIGFQLVNIGYGLLLLIRRPVLKLPKKADLLLGVGAIAITLLMLETGARVWLNFIASPDQYQRYALFTGIDAANFRWAPHHYLNYYPRPNFRRGLTSHNSLGYRDREFSTTKPGGTFRIVALGGSTTYTEMVEDNDKTFTARLEAVLRDAYGYENVEVINAGVSGYTSWESLINLQFRVLDLDPDLVIVYHGTNDVHTRLVQPGTYRGDNAGRRKQWQPPDVVGWQRSALLRIVSFRVGFARQVDLESFVSAPTARLFANLPPETLEQHPPAYFERNLANMIAVAKAHDVAIMFATWAHSPHFADYAALPVYRQGFAENNEAVKRVATTHRIPLFDFAAAMPQDRMYWADGRHVNEAGALTKARLFAKFIHEQNLIPTPGSDGQGSEAKAK